MANVRAGNTWYADATGSLTGGSSNEPLYVSYITISASTAGSGTPSVTITDAAPSPNTKFKLSCDNTETILLDFSNKPVQFFGGITISAISGAAVTFVLSGGDN